MLVFGKIVDEVCVEGIDEVIVFVWVFVGDCLMMLIMVFELFLKVFGEFIVFYEYIIFV